jgi:hypothetical protein
MRVGEREPDMSRSTGGGLRLAAMMILLAASASACVPAERPRLGPPALGINQARGLGPAPIKGKEVVRFAFITVTGVPAQMRFDLEKSLKKYAATRNLAIAIEDDPTATYRIKGYLSAVGDVNGTLLVYTFDVYDSAGRPLHRISGQQSAGGSDSDPWAGIQSAQIDDSAREIIDELAEWVRS